MQNSATSESQIKKSKVSSARELFANLNIQDGNSTTGDPKIHVETNVNFLSDDDDNTDNFLKNNTTFICIKHHNSNVCDAETQIYIPRGDKVNCKSSINETIKCAKASETCTTGFHGYSSVKDAADEVRDLCGVSLETFKLFLTILLRQKFDNRQKVSMKDRLCIFLMKMRTGLTFTALGALFRLHRTTVSTIFTDTLVYLVGACKNFVSWPTKETIRAMMPDVFKDSYKNCRVIIDCTEFHVEQPSKIKHRVQFYSRYKKGFRLKVLVGCTPSGHISFVSRCYGGKSTDAQITSTCGFLDLLEPGDLVLADKGFPQIKTLLDENGKGILMVMPPFLYNKTFTAEQVEETYQVASVRIHIERVMQRIRTYKIVDKFTIDLLPYSDAIVLMCCILVNLQPPIIKVEEAKEGEDYLKNITIVGKL